MTSGYSIQRLLQDDSKSEDHTNEDKRELVFPLAPKAFAMMMQNKVIEQRKYFIAIFKARKSHPCIKYCPKQIQCLLTLCRLSEEGQVCFSPFHTRQLKSSKCSCVSAILIILCTKVVPEI
jgi:hypothetical protein